MLSLMKEWNWQHPDWPNFRYDARALDEAERAFLLGCGTFLGAALHLSDADGAGLVVELLSDEALSTSRIEGEIFDRASVQSSLRRHLGLGTDDRRSLPAEEGVAALVTEVWREPLQPLSEEMLFGWHRLLMDGRPNIGIGVYRQHAEPMQIVSGYLHAPTVHFEAPPSAQVPEEMARFVTWFNDSGPGGRTPMPPLARAGIAHLYFEAIHPFEDGNGRIGRALIEKSFAQSIGRPLVSGLSTTIVESATSRRAYYDALEHANGDVEVTEWLRYFAETSLAAQRATQLRIDFILAKTRLYDRLAGHLNDRQGRALAKMFEAGIGGFVGGMSAEKYCRITGASASTATRDLADLQALGALTRTGERKHTRYWLKLPDQRWNAIWSDPAGADFPDRIQPPPQERDD